MSRRKFVAQSFYVVSLARVSPCMLHVGCYGSHLGSLWHVVVIDIVVVVDVVVIVITRTTLKAECLSRHPT